MAQKLRFVRRPPVTLGAPFVIRRRGLGETAYIDPTSGARVSGEGGGSSSTSSTSIYPPPVPQLWNGGPPVYGTTGSVGSAVPEGTLLAVTGTSPTYLVTGGQKHWIPNGATFNALGFQVSQIDYVDRATFDSVPTGASLEDLSGQAATPAAAPSSEQTATIAPTVTSTPSIIQATPTGVVATSMQSGAVWDTALGGWLNPDGSVFYPPTATTLEAGAVYNSTIGAYVNPDGSIYGATTAASSFTLTSPSTWPTWMWVVVVGGGAFLLLKKK
jgi:hypothetical protein